MIEEVIFYAATCDNCGEGWNNDHYGWSAMSDECSLKDMLSNDEWQSGDHLEDETHKGKHYCPSCFEYDDDDNFILKHDSKKKK